MKYDTNKDTNTLSTEFLRYTDAIVPQQFQIEREYEIGQCRMIQLTYSIDFSEGANVIKGCVAPFICTTPGYEFRWMGEVVQRKRTS